MEADVFEECMRDTAFLLKFAFLLLSMQHNSGREKKELLKQIKLLNKLILKNRISSTGLGD